jgi:hypothetical protein
MKKQREKRPALNVVRGNGGKAKKPAQAAPQNQGDGENEGLIIEREKTERGVVEVIIRDTARRGFEIWNSAGECLEYVEWPIKRVTEARIDNLWYMLDAEDPDPPPLRLS